MNQPVPLLVCLFLRGELPENMLYNVFAVLQPDAVSICYGPKGIHSWPQDVARHESCVLFLAPLVRYDTADQFVGVCIVSQIPA